MTTKMAGARRARPGRPRSGSRANGNHWRTVLPPPALRKRDERLDPQFRPRFRRARTCRVRCGSRASAQRVATCRFASTVERYRHPGLRCRPAGHRLSQAPFVDAPRATGRQAGRPTGRCILVVENGRHRALTLTVAQKRRRSWHVRALEEPRKVAAHVCSCRVVGIRYHFDVLP